MSILSNFTKAGRRLYNYAFSFLNTQGRRRDHGSQIQPQSAQLDETGRDKAHVLGRDLYKDSSLFRWAVDFHCKNTTGFVFQAKSKDKGFNQTLEQYYDYFNRTLDFSGRYSFEELREIWERRAVIDGDVLLVKLNNGQIQSYQSDWIRGNDNGFVQGVKLDEYGRPLGYQIERTTTNGETIRMFYPARHSILIAYWTGEFDAYRGVSPLAPSFAIFEDLNDVQEFMTAKIKLEASMGIFLKKSKANSPFTFSAPDLPDEPADENIEGHVNADSSYTNYQREKKRQWDFSKPGIKGFELEDGEDITQVGNNSPGSTFKDYFLATLQAGLKPLSIPLTIYQENLSNYYCSRAAYGLYQYQTLNRLKFNRALYAKLFLWRLALDSINGTIDLPQNMLVEEIPFSFIPEEHSVLDMDREMKGHGVGVQFGFVSPQQVCGKFGRDYYQTVDEIAQAQQYAKEKGVTLSCFGKGEDNAGNET